MKTSNKTKVVYLLSIIISIIIIIIALAYCKSPISAEGEIKDQLQQQENKASSSATLVILDSWRLVKTISNGKRTDKTYFVGYLENKGTETAFNVRVEITLAIGEEDVEVVRTSIHKIKGKDRLKFEQSLKKISQLSGVWLSKNSILWD